MVKVKEWIETSLGHAIDPVDADLGIEIEVEGENLPTSVGNLWRVDRDGSLRGESYEYVSVPIKYEKLDDTLNQLEAAYKKSRSNVHESIRAGVHVHRNVQDFSAVQLFNLAVSYFAIEDLLMKWAGESREGNHFCLRAKDGEFVLFQLQRVADTRLIKYLNTDTIRYCSLNLFSLFKYGTVEFRGMRGTADLSAIKLWTEMLYSLTENSKRYSDPLDIIMSMSGSGEDAFLRTLLPDHHRLVSFDGYENNIRESIRRLQFVANTTNWSEFESKIKVTKPKTSSVEAVAEIPAGNFQQVFLDNVLFNAAPPPVAPNRLRGLRIERAQAPEPVPDPLAGIIFDDVDEIPNLDDELA